MIVLRLAMVAALVACLATPAADAANPTFDPATVYRIPLGASPQTGPVDAPITIVEFSDFACGYCSRVQATLRQLALLYPNAIRTVHRTLPLDTENTLAAEAALAAHAQGRYLAMHDRLYELHGRVDRIDVELLAQAIGLDLLTFRKDIDEGRYRPSVRADEADARALGVTGTPMFFINGRPINGAAALHEFVTMLETELVRANAAVRAGAKPADLYSALTATGKTVADSDSEDAVGFELNPNAVYKVGLGLPGHVDGPADALVTIVTFSDFECPYCVRSAPVLAKLRQQQPDRVRIVFRHLPMPFHANAGLAAEAAVEAGVQGKFWPFHDGLFLHILQKGGLSRPELEAVAAAAGLAMPAFRTALDDRRHRDAVRADAAAGAALGISATPTMFINGMPVVGSRSVDSLAPIVQAQLDAAGVAIRGSIRANDIYAFMLTEAADEDRSDPAAVPLVHDMAGLALRDLQRVWALAAACRRHDLTTAAKLWRETSPLHRRQLAATCGVAGLATVAP